jgi:hypothetical protein
VVCDVSEKFVKPTRYAFHICFCAKRERCSVRQVNMTIISRLPCTRLGCGRHRGPTATRHRRYPIARCASRMVPPTRDARPGLLMGSKLSPNPNFAPGTGLPTAETKGREFDLRSPDAI